jgi:hypothetical protein
MALVVLVATTVSSDGCITSVCADIGNMDVVQAFLPMEQTLRTARWVPGIRISDAKCLAGASLR